MLSFEVLLFIRLPRIYHGQIPPGVKQSAAMMGEDDFLSMMDKASAEFMYTFHGVPLSKVKVLREDKIP